MKNKSITYIKYPLVLISIALCVSGVRWLISSEPWLLDQVANEERLQKTFEKLFSTDVESTLSAYLTQIYRFLGFYVLGVGFLLLSFTANKFLEISIVRQRLLTVLGILLVSNLVLAYTWIPSSHFIYVMWGAIGLYSLSLYNHIKS
ncbi:hypothetical protein OAA78_03715 [Flavobacteriaceae bacterium]|nr:hypothetical protein [Flavobacteriaceae bacterium]MDB9712774.1 hypothetical protein [Flavobacteriaceae bacterium]MDC1491761.1 hypothetical protein [Flavobacteriaceae bacterium]